MGKKGYTRHRIGLTLLGMLFAAGFYYFRTLIHETGWVYFSRLLLFLEVAGWAGLAVTWAMIACNLRLRRRKQCIL